MGKKKRKKAEPLEHRVTEGAQKGAEVAHRLHEVMGKPPPHPQGALAHAAATAAVMAAGAVVGAGAVLVADDEARSAAAKATKKARKRAAAAADAAVDWVKGLW